MAATARALDMTDVNDGGGAFNKSRVPTGDYLARIVKVEDAAVKDGDNKGQPQWLFTIVPEKFKSRKFPYYCTLVPNQLWKVRNLATAAGITVPKKRIKIDPNKLVGKLVAVTLEDDEYKGREQSSIASVFPASELEPQTEPDLDDEDDEDDDEVEAPPAPKARVKKPAPPVDEDDDEEDDEEDEPAPPPVRKKRVAAPPPPPDDEDEDDEEDDEEEPPPPPRKRAAKKAAARKPADEELDELDLDDL